jgi:WD40 repeat protein
MRLQHLRSAWFGGLLGLIAWSLADSELSYAQSAVVSPGPPILRIEPGSHFASIRAADSDASGRYLVTASDDKTARIWSLEEARQELVLRPPIGTGKVGSLSAVAMSPAADVIAVSGWSEGNDILIFSRLSGQVIQRLTGLPNLVTKLRFSPNGESLALGLFGANGLRLLKTTDRWQTASLMASDTQYEGSLLGLSWNSTGTKIATSSFDGFIRLYEVGRNQLQMKKQVALAEGKRPFALQYSPDDSLLAVGLEDVPKIALLGPEDLSLKAWALGDSALQGQFPQVSWRRDGQVLYGAGTYRTSQGAALLQQWQIERSSGTVQARLLSAQEVGRDSVTELVALPNQRTVAALADGTWTLLASGGKPDRFGVRGGIDFRPPGVDWKTSPNLSKFNLGQGKAFDLNLGISVLTDPEMQGPRLQSGGLQIVKGRSAADTRVAGVNVALDDNEIPLSAAVSLKGDQAALGSQGAVRKFDRQGRLQWTVAMPAAAWHLAWSTDGRWLLVACGDGTVRWLRARDGSEQLAVFVHADRQRWVAWTPSGHYSASPGGEDLVGWHQNGGADRRGDFFPASRLRASQYRPDVIAAVLSSGDAVLALDQSNQALGRVKEVPVASKALPPVVEVISPNLIRRTGSSNLDIALKIRSALSAPVAGVKVRVDGQLVSVESLKALPPPERARGEEITQARFSLPVPLGAREIHIFAESSAGVSAPAVVQIEPNPDKSPVNPAPNLSAPNLPAGEPDFRPVMYVLAVGVSDYKDTSLKLDYSAKDAKDFSEALSAQQGKLYRQVVVKLLTDKLATRDSILDGLEWIRRQMTARDVGVVFLAGHGVNDPDGIYYYLPYDTQTDKLKRSGVIFTEIKNTLASLPGKAMFFVDTCHSGNVLGSAKTRGSPQGDLTRVVNELSSAENGVIVFAASTGKQLAQEAFEWKNGAFTLALLEGLKGAADFSKTGRVTHKMLDLYVSERVKALTKGAQSPVTIVPQGLPDFPLAISAR